MTGFRNSAWFFRNPVKKRSLGIFLRKDFAYENMFLGLGYRMLKTTGLYLVPIKSYSKHNRLP
jgi:hypothetical protein